MAIQMGWIFLGSNDLSAVPSIPYLKVWLFIRNNSKHVQPIFSQSSSLVKANTLYTTRYINGPWGYAINAFFLESLLSINATWKLKKNKNNKDHLSKNCIFKKMYFVSKFSGLLREKIVLNREQRVFFWISRLKAENFWDH